MHVVCWKVWRMTFLSVPRGETHKLRCRSESVRLSQETVVHVVHETVDGRQDHTVAFVAHFAGAHYLSDRIHQREDCTI